LEYGRLTLDFSRVKASKASVLLRDAKVGKGLGKGARKAFHQKMKLETSIPCNGIRSLHGMDVSTAEERGGYPYWKLIVKCNAAGNLVFYFPIITFWVMNFPSVVAMRTK